MQTFTIDINDISTPAAWDGDAADDEWSNPVNWVGDVLPGLDNDVQISAAFSGHTIQSSTNVAIHKIDSEASLQVLGGEFRVAAASTFHDLLQLSGGTLTGAGDVTDHGQFRLDRRCDVGTGKTIVASAATGTLLPTSDYLYLARTLENAGQTTLSTSPSGYVMLVGDFGGGGTISNLAGGTFTLDDSAGISDYGMNWGQVSAMNNAGTIRHTGEGTSYGFCSTAQQRQY